MLILNTCLRTYFIYFPLLVTTALFNFFMVIFRHWLMLGKDHILCFNTEKFCSDHDLSLNNQKPVVFVA